jgi:6-pyruvoyltetrahydropterin/6-carboxytetrahydropterin synthase
MYILRTEHSFDSAHFLPNYEGKCSNIHGHRWRVVVEVKSKDLVDGGQLDGMVVDFGDLKDDVKEMADFYDHCLIIMKGSMRKETLDFMVGDGFKVIEVDFRPTAEKFAWHFFKLMEKKGYRVHKVEVYETPTNCAVYVE